MIMPLVLIFADTLWEFLLQLCWWGPGRLYGRALDFWLKGCEFESQQGQWENFISRANFVCWHFFDVCSTSVLPQWHVKDPSHSAKNCRWQTRLHTWRIEVGVGWLCRCSGIVWEPIKNRAHIQLITEHLTIVISSHWATADRSWRKEWN